MDGVFVGPNDLSISLTNGALADPSTPDLISACGTIANAAARAGKPAGIYANTPELAATYREMASNSSSSAMI